MQNPLLLIVLIIVNVPVYFVVGRLLFGDWVELGRTIRLLLTPGWLNMLQGEAVDGGLAPIRVLWFVILSGGMVGNEYLFLLDRLRGNAEWLGRH